MLKCATFTVSSRLKIALEKHNILPNFFTAYKKGLSCSDTIKNVLCIIENSLNFKSNLCILNTDLTSAFDTLSRGLVFDVMRLANFPNFFTDSIKKVQNGAKIHVMSTILSPLGEPVCQTSGFSQGDALSGDLFNLGLLPLIIVLNYRRSIDRYHLRWDNNSPLHDPGSTPICTTMTYSDDCISMLTSDNDYASIFQTLDLVKRYATISSLQLSLPKTCVCFLGALPAENIMNAFISFGLERENLCTSFDFLGYRFNCADLHSGVNELFEQKTEKIKTIFTAYSQCKSLTLAGRKVIANSLCASQFSFIFQPAFLIKQSNLSKAQSLINNFCLVKRICLIEQSYLSTSNGGLAIPFLFHKYVTAKVSLLHKAIRQERRFEADDRAVPQPWVIYLLALL